MSQSLSTILREMATALRERIRPQSGDGLKDTAVFIAAPAGVIAAINNDLHLGSASEMVSSLLGSQGIALEEGDTVVSNDPYLGSSHVQDFYLLSPVYFKGAPIFYLGAKAHLPDIGGDVQGGFNSRAEEIWAEGVRISPVKICRDGQVDTGIFNMILLNTRTADAVRLGLESLIAAVEAGKKEVLGSAPDSKGMVALQSKALQTIAETEHRVRQVVSSWPSGEYSGDCSVADDSTKIDGTKIETKLGVKGSELTIDLSMNPPQLKRPFNSSRGNTLSSALLPCLPLFTQDAAINGGIWRVITIKTKKGTLVDPLLPAPTSFSPFHVGFEISGAVTAALENFLPQQEKERMRRQLPSLLHWHPRS
jgi:N-methylhydantoinase B